MGIERLRSSRTIWVVSAASTARRFFRCTFRAYLWRRMQTAERRAGPSEPPAWVMVLGEVYAITIELVPDRQFVLPRVPPASRISAATSHILTSTQILARPEGEWQQPRHWPATASSPSRPILDHLCDHSVGWGKIHFRGWMVSVPDAGMFLYDVVPAEAPSIRPRPWGHPLPDLAETFLLCLLNSLIRSINSLSGCVGNSARNRLIINGGLGTRFGCLRPS